MSATFDPPLGDDSAQTETHRAFGLSGGTIGPYRLLEPLGEGGMGKVWLAEQTHPLRRQVALKIIKAGMDTAQVVARFEAERQALALMDHPAIAKVFDAGSTASGHPYFAMEYVRGESVTAYCDRQRLTIRERLELFVHVCDGVQHAHQKGIIHRDLKPSNILVTLLGDRPVPKIIDFGVAKATSQPLTEHTLYTSLSGFVGTPDYMSPEQADAGGVDIDTRTDVYALGVILYELLTGVLPFDRHTLKDKSIDEIRRTIRESDPLRPSTRITQLAAASTDVARTRRAEPSLLRSLLRGDLDWITMKALEKDRSRRYDTAIGLANDVRRHLRNEPVLAGPPSALYRTKKFVRRYPIGVGAAATFVVLLVALAATMTIQAQRIARERDRANNEAQTATQVSDFLVGLFEGSQPSEAAANSVTAREILDEGAKQIEQELRGRPEVRAAMLTTMGRAYARLGLYKKAEDLLAAALELQRQIAPASSAVPKVMVALADAIDRQGRYSDAERLSRSALELLRGGPDSQDGLLAECLAQLASSLTELGKYVEAEATSREAIQIYRRMRSPPPQFPIALGTLGTVLVKRADYAGAETVLEEATDLMRKSRGTAHPTTLVGLKNLAVVWTYQGKHSKAEAAYREIVAAERERLGPDHPALATSLNNLGAVLFIQHKYVEASDAYREAQSIARRSLGDSHPNIARYDRNLGQSLTAQGKYSEAETLMREALVIDRAALGNDHPSVALTLVFLSDTLTRAGRQREAEQVAREALTINIHRLGPDHPRTKDAQGALGIALAKQRRWPEAEELLLKYGALLESSKSDVEGDFDKVARLIVEMYEAWGKPEKAAEWRRKAAK